MFQSSLFSILPEFRKKGRKLILRSSWKTRWLSLGLIDRTMTVDPDRQVIIVRDRRFWFDSRVERYPFDLITAVSFHFAHFVDEHPSWSTRDSIESYAVGLKIYGTSDPDVHLFWFIGEGRLTSTGSPIWLGWYRAMTDVAGTHEEEAQSFIKAFGWALMKPIVPK